MSPDIKRLVELVCMLPDPGSPRSESFWRQVSREAKRDRHYIMEKVSVHMELATDGNDRVGYLAEYMLMFFDQASPDLAYAIANEVEPGAATAAMGRRWLEDLRATSWRVLYGKRQDSAEAIAAWRACEWWNIND